MDLVEALRTTAAVREFLPTPVPDDVVFRVLDNARFAPSGGNRQGWRVVVAKDPGIRRGLRDLYLPAWYEYLAQRSAGLTPWAPVTDEVRERDAIGRAGEFAARAARRPGFPERLDEAPVLIVLLADLRELAAVDKGFDRYTLVGGASVYPFAWSILLAARAEGLGGVFTTMVTKMETEARELLGAPDELVVAGVLALGYPQHQVRRLNRRQVEEFATVDRYDGAPLRPV